MRPGWLSIVLFTCLFPTAVLAGKNAGGALIVHTNDSYTYSASTACTTTYAEPASCEDAITRTDKSEDAVVWLLAAFPDTSSPAVTVVYFGIDYDTVNLDPGSAYKLCGPPGSLEVPDADWPYAGRGNSVAFGSPVVDHLLFSFYAFKVDGGTDGSHFSSSANPTAGYAAFVDDADPPVMDEISKFGTIRWFAAGVNECPAGPPGEGGGGADGAINDGDNAGGGADDGEGTWLDGDGQSNWIRNSILVLLKPELPMPPRGPVAQLGIGAFDSLSQHLGVQRLERVLFMQDSICAQFPIGSRLVRASMGPGSDEVTAARLFSELSEVQWAEPNYASRTSLLTEHVEQQWYIGEHDTTSCRPGAHPNSCCQGCDIGVSDDDGLGAWMYSRGDPNVIIGFMDGGADMQHPDLRDAFAVNPHRGTDATKWEDRNGDGVAQLCDFDPEHPEVGDLDGLDNDSSGVIDDVVLGWRIAAGAPPDSLPWHRVWDHHQGDHGTPVAGLLGGLTNNNLGITSAAGGDYSNPGNPIRGVRLIQFSHDQYFDPEDAWYAAFYYAYAYGARVFSSSSCKQIQGNAIPTGIAELSPDMLFLQGTGNEGADSIGCDMARIPNVMAVGGYECASGARWKIPNGYWGWGGANYGPEMSIVGPTNDATADAAYSRMVLASTYPTGHAYCPPPDTTDDRVGCFGGTSAATPITASVAALVWSYLYDEMPPFHPAQHIRMILAGC